MGEGQGDSSTSGKWGSVSPLPLIPRGAVCEGESGGRKRRGVTGGYRVYVNFAVMSLVIGRWSLSESRGQRHPSLIQPQVISRF